MDTVANLNNIVVVDTILDGLVLCGRAVAKADVLVVAIPTVTVRVGECEDDVAGIPQGEVAFC